MKNLLSILLLVVLVIVFASCKNNKEETKETNTVNTEVVTETETQVQTEKETQTPTEPPLTNKDILETGMWVVYSPQDTVFNVYEFSDGIVMEKSYSYSEETVKNYMDDVYMTYEIQGNKIVILDEYGYAREWSFTDDPSVIMYSWQEYFGPEPGPVVTQKVFHHDTLPTYQQAVEESSNG